MSNVSAILIVIIALAALAIFGKLAYGERKDLPHWCQRDFAINWGLAYLFFSLFVWITFAALSTEPVDVFRPIFYGAGNFEFMVELDETSNVERFWTVAGKLPRIIIVAWFLVFIVRAVIGATLDAWRFAIRKPNVRSIMSGGNGPKIKGPWSSDD